MSEKSNLQLMPLEDGEYLHSLADSDTRDMSRTMIASVSVTINDDATGKTYSLPTESKGFKNSLWKPSSFLEH